MTNQDTTLTNQDVLPSDEQIADAFKNTNFGSTDFRAILLEGLRSTALGYHNGWTLTQILRRLNLGETKDIDSNKLNERGLRFIEQAATQVSESEINSLKQCIQELESWKNQANAVESEWDCQSVGKALNIPLGNSIRENILPKIKELTASNNQLREALERMIESYQYEASSENQSLLNAFKVLESTPAQSLAEHDNEVTAPYKKALEFAEHMAKSTEQFMIAINQLDEADQEEDEETVEIMQEKRGEHWRAVNSSIYEFRQRSDRALKASHG